MNAKIEWFEQTSDGLYDRHDYEIVYSNSQSVIVDSWDAVEIVVLKHHLSFVSHIEVLDKKPPKSKSKDLGRMTY